MLTDETPVKPKIKVVSGFEPAKYVVQFEGVAGPLHDDIPSAMREAVAVADTNVTLAKLWAQLAEDDDPSPFLDDIFPCP